MPEHSRKPGVGIRSAFARYADLYPSARPRIEALLTSSDPKIQRRIAVLAKVVSDHQEGRHARLMERHHLTPTESRLAIHIIDGGDISSYASEAGVSPGTARSQLKSVFAKTGVNRQSALVRLGHSDA
jgi:DNA-binding CsgD family transcriptional regulator